LARYHHEWTPYTRQCQSIDRAIAIRRTLLDHIDCCYICEKGVLCAIGQEMYDKIEDSKANLKQSGIVL
jgi:hypothetical protein